MQLKEGPPSRKAHSDLTLTHSNADGINTSSAAHYVVVPLDWDDEPLREFRSITADLAALADWLAGCGVDPVAMESTGVNWIPSSELLDGRGFNVLLVNTCRVKNVSGRKSEVLDCQWLQQLMKYGLHSGAFRPSDQVCVLCALWRQRSMLLKDQGGYGARRPVDSRVRVLVMQVGGAADKYQKDLMPLR